MPRLQYSNDETLPKSGAVKEDHHADTTQIHRHAAGRRRSAHHKRTTGAAAVAIEIAECSDVNAGGTGLFRVRVACPTGHLQYGTGHAMKRGAGVNISRL